MKTTQIKIKQIPAILAAAIALLGAMNSNATSYTFNVTSGAWNVNANWTPSTGFPGASDTAIIPTGDSVTGMGGASEACTTLTIQGTGSVIVDANTLTVSGVTTVGSSGAATLTISSGGTFTSTSTSGSAIVYGGTGSSIVNNGAFNCSGGNGSGGTTPTFQNNGTATFTGSQQSFNSAVAVTQGASAVLNLNSSSSTPFGGSSTLIATASGNTVSYGASGVNYKATTYQNMTFTGSGSAGQSWPTTTVNGTLTVGGSVSLVNFSGTIGALTVNNSTGSVTGNSKVTVSGALTATSGTFYAQNGLAVSGTTTINGGTLELGNQSSGNGAFTGNFTLSSGTFNSGFGGQNDAVSFGGSLTVSGGTFTSGTGVNTFSGSGQTISGTISIPSVTVSGTYQNNGTLTVGTALAGSGTLTQGTNAALNIGGTSASSLTLAASVNTPNTVAFTSTSSQTILADTYNNLTVSGASTKTLAGAVTVNGTLTISAGTLADGGFTLSANGNVVNSGTHTGAGQISLTGGSASHSLSGTGAYQNLALNDANGASIASGTSTVNGTLTLTLGQLTSGGGALTLGNSAAISRAAGSLSSLTPTFGTSVNVTYNGTTATATGSELPASATVLNNLTINDAAGITLNAGATLKGTLTLTSGQLIAGANTLTVTSSGAISGGSSSSYVYGTLSRGLATGSGKSAAFPVGDGSVYAPVSLASATVSTAGNLVVSTTPNNDAQGAFSSSGLSQIAYVDRDWTITAANGYVESAGSITLNFVAGDIQGSMSTSADVVGKYSGVTWTKPTVASRTSTSITVSGITSFSDWVIGNLPIPTFSGLSSPTIAYGTSMISLSGNLSANAGSAFPVNGSTVTASINGYSVNGTVTDSAGDFTINYNDPSLAGDPVAGSQYTVTYSFTGDANLAAAANDASTSLTVNPAALVITAQPRTITYGSNVPAGTVTYAGFVNGQTNSALSTQPAISSAQSGILAPGTYSGNYTASGAAAANYAISYNNTIGTLTVNPAALVITAQPQSITYGASVPATTVTYNGFVNGDTSDSLTAQPIISSAQSGVAAAGTYTGNYTATGAADANYSISYVAGDLTVNPLAVVLTGTRNYDGTDIATNSILAVSNVVGADDVTVASGSCTLESADIGTNAITSFDTLTLGGGAESNYTLTDASGAVIVTPEPLIITAQPQTITYGASVPATTVTYSGFVNGDTETNLTTEPTISSAQSGVAQAGTYTGNYTASDAVGSTNYAISYVAGDLTVSQAIPVITGLNSPTIIYGTTSIALSGTVSADGPVYPSSGDVVTATINGYTVSGTIVDSMGDFSIAYNDPSLAIDPVDSSPYAITYVFEGDTNFDAATNTDILTVNPYELIITASGQSKTYGTALAFPASSSAFTMIGALQNGDTITSVTLSDPNNGGAAAAAPGGTYPLVPSAATGSYTPDNYSITYNNGLLAVNPAPLLVTADSFSQPYGAANPAFTVTYSNFVNGEVLGTSDVAGSPMLTTDADTNSPVGAYDITNSLGTLTSTNYSFDLVDGTLTITNAISTNDISSSENPALPGDSVTFSATLSTLAPSLAVPYGTVQFQIDGVPFDSAVTLSNGVAVSDETGTLSHGFHTIEADDAGDTNIAGSTNIVIELINTPPVAGLATYSRPAGQALILPVSSLLTNATDADGDPISLVAVSPESTNGAAISTDGTNVIYTPPATNGDVTDNFSYTVADIFGATSTNIVVVTVQSGYSNGPAVTINSIISNMDGTVTMDFTGIPGLDYLVQATTNLTAPITWTTISTNMADTNGLFNFTDLCATNYSARYYRTSIPQQ